MLFFVQTVFIISVCNNQLLNWIENELIWVLGHIPGFASILPRVVANLHAVKDKYLKAPHSVSPNIKVTNHRLQCNMFINVELLIYCLRPSKSYYNLSNYFPKVTSSIIFREQNGISQLLQSGTLWCGLCF
jgi:hypothetical protein